MRPLAFFLLLLANFTFAQSGKVLDSESLPSKILGGNRKYAVYLPPDYETSKRSYPVLYLLHGAGDDQTGWVQFGEVLNITDKQSEYARFVEDSMKNAGFRVVSDLRNEKIGFKIREHTIQKVPYLLVVGDKEVESQTVAVRARRGEDLGSMDLNAFIAHLTNDVACRGRIVLENQY